ncbi:MAG: UDP-N-acetylmuramoyl-L-alanine--D-glutamate ligase [Planctomycetes bacterium]|nr:UDP-N-acetylmuramoyl-L-alanine--D-glutamate ligase [Planctomycetota bacterium]
MNSPDPALPPRDALVLVHGLGRFGGGREAVRHLARRGCRVRVADRADGDDLRAVAATFADQPAVEWCLGREDEALLDGVQAMVVSPAVPDHHPLLQAAIARGVPLTQEVELFLAAYPGRVLGVTGTNGKSSTSMLLHRALLASGHDALLGGNIGHSLLADEALWRRAQWAVLELSSFQLERLGPARRLHGAVFTRVATDHLDRHGTLAAYHAAKGRLAAAADAFVVCGADDPVAAGYATSAQQRGWYTAGPPGPVGAGTDGGWLCVRPDRDPAERLVHQDALRLLGDFQRENVLAAGLAARLCGAAPHAIGFAMATAAPLPFRLQLVHVREGVRIYDNGVSTEVDSTRRALATLQALGGRVHWVGGGKSKDGDHAAVARAIAPLAGSAQVFGAAAAPFAAAVAQEQLPLPTAAHATLRQALDAALAAARPGDAVLFSPAFASFDQYPNFRARALEFHALLRERRATGATSG